MSVPAVFTSGDSLKYDTTEAESLFAFARGRVPGLYAEPRGIAISALLQQLKSVVVEIGCKASLDETGALSVKDQGRSVFVGDIRGEVLVAQLIDGKRGDRVAAPLDFDPISKLFVDKQTVDVFFTTTLAGRTPPGKFRVFRSAKGVCPTSAPIGTRDGPGDGLDRHPG